MAHIWMKNYGASKLVLVEDGQLKNGTTFELTLEAGWGVRRVDSIISFMQKTDPLKYVSYQQIITQDDETIGYGNAQVDARIYQENNGIVLYGGGNARGKDNDSTSYSQTQSNMQLNFFHNNLSKYSKVFARFSLTGTTSYSQQGSAQGTLPYFIIDFPNATNSPWDSQGHLLRLSDTNNFSQSYESKFTRTNKDSLYFYISDYVNTRGYTAMYYNVNLIINDLVLYK